MPVEVAVMDNLLDLGRFLEEITGRTDLKEVGIEIGQGHGLHQRSIVISGFMRRMVMPESFDHIIVQLPFAGDDPARGPVVKAEDHGFGPYQGAALEVTELKDLAVVIGKAVAERDFTQVVEKAGHKKFFPLGQRDIRQAGNGFGGDADTDGMGQELIHGQTFHTLLADAAEDGCGQGEVLYRVDAEHDDSSGQGGDLIGQGVIGRVDQFQDLARENRIKGDDAVEIIGRGGGLITDFQNLGDRGRQAGHPVDVFADFIEILLGGRV